MRLASLCLSAALLAGCQSGPPTTTVPATARDPGDAAAAILAADSPSATNLKATLQAIRLAIESHTQNLACQDVDGYKQSATVFVAGSSEPRLRRDQSKGSARITGSPLDIYIDGQGFFQLSSIQHPETPPIYSRAGRFLINHCGQLVLDTNTDLLLEPALTMPPNTRDICIGLDGRVSCKVTNLDFTQDVGQIQLTTFADPASLVTNDGVFFSRSDQSSLPVVANPGADAAGQVVQGAVESSNVDLDSEMVEIAKLTRWFRIVSQTLSDTTAPAPPIAVTQPRK